MENLFSAHINIEDQAAVPYHIVFENEKYVFNPDPANKDLSSFSFKREHDEWHTDDPLNAEVKGQALEALEKYLLAQH